MNSLLYAEVNLDQLEHNVKSLIHLYPNYEYYFGMVNANAYGHGFGVLKTMMEAGINYFVTSTYEEALLLRHQIKRVPILCLESLTKENINLAVKNHITATIYKKEDALLLVSEGVRGKLKVHLKVRFHDLQLGFANGQDLVETKRILEESKIFIEGIYAEIDSVTEEELNLDLNRFLLLTKPLAIENIPIVHFYSSRSLLRYPKLKMANGVRFGILMYGINPTEEILKFDLQEPFSLCTFLSDIRVLDSTLLAREGFKIASKVDMLVGVLPVGYADGFTKDHIGRNVTVHFKRFKILSIHMHSMYVEVDEDSKVGDKVLLYGGLITLKESSNYLQRSVYELLCSISPCIPKYYMKENEIQTIERR